MLVRSETEDAGSDLSVLVSSGYALSAVTAAVIVLTAAVFFTTIPINTFIDILDIPAAAAGRLLFFMTSASAAMLFLNIYIKIYNSRQRTAAALLPDLAASALFLAAISAASSMQIPVFSRLKSVVILFRLLSITAAAAATFVLFRQHPVLKPKLSRIRISRVKEIIQTGMPFFMIQLSYALIHSTDNIIISNRLGSADRYGKNHFRRAA